MRFCATYAAGTWNRVHREPVGPHHLTKGSITSYSSLSQHRMTIQTLHIQWTGPIPFADVASLTDRRTDYGVYQVYGRHPVYGQHALLYLGRAQKKTFGVRHIPGYAPFGSHE